MKEIFNEILDDQEKLALQMFADNEVQTEAVRKILMREIYTNGVVKKGQKVNPMINSFIGLTRAYTNNDDLANQARALSEAINLVESAFKVIEEFKKPPESKAEPKINQAL